MGSEAYQGRGEMRLSAADYHVTSDKPRSFNSLDGTGAKLCGVDKYRVTEKAGPCALRVLAATKKIDSASALECR
jgi:hypothetical protein